MQTNHYTKVNASFDAYLKECLRAQFDSEQDNETYTSINDVINKDWFMTTFKHEISTKSMQSACTYYLQGLGLGTVEYYTSNIVEMFKNGKLLSGQHCSKYSDNEIDDYYWQQLGAALMRHLNNK